MFKYQAVVKAIVLAAGLLTGFAAVAASYPTEKEIKVIIPRSPGGGTDAAARSIIHLMQKDLGNVKFAPVNKPDANGLAGMVELAHAEPDGYTLGMVTVELDMFVHEGKTKLTYDSFASIISPIAAPAALIVPKDSPFESLQGFVDYLKANPGEISMGNSGVGAIWHVATLVFEQAFDVKVKHIPYPNGTADILTAMLSGHVDGVLADPSFFKSQIDTGKFKVLAIMADGRTNLYPAVPTFKELGYDLVIRAWATLAAPKNTPKDKLKLLRESAKRVTRRPEYFDYFIKQGIDPTAIIGEDADRMMADDNEMYAAFMREYLRKINR